MISAEHLFMMLSIDEIFEKAVERFHRDLERLGLLPVELPGDAEDAVNPQRREVHLSGPAGMVVGYTYKLTRTGRLRFRPIWSDSFSMG